MRVKFPVFAILTVLLIVTHSACTSSDRNTDNTPPDSRIENTSDGGETASDPTEHVDEASLSASSDLPEGWPEDVPIMEGFTILEARVVESRNDRSNRIDVTVQGDATFEEIIEFYRSLPGWSYSGDNASLVQNEDGFYISIVKGRDMLMIQGRFEEAIGQNVLVLSYIPLNE